ncbi:hypothetical protein [Lacticaseibacillus kribbianus]|uniref:hypothetical protein n=1 Tax=Lacticaseibacillus kribbianus TaxID=2926292 RepID=UPI001CD2FE8D|nr:hypothetical protein [Lacticaseibacillus kribbianus]
MRDRHWWRRLGLGLGLIGVLAVALVLLPPRAARAAVTVPSAITAPAGFVTPSPAKGATGSGFRTQPNWSGYGYTMLGVESAPTDEEKYAAFVNRGFGYLHLYASFRKAGGDYLSGYKIVTRRRIGSGPVTISTDPGGFGEQPGVVWDTPMQYWPANDFIDYKLAFNDTITTPTWVTFQVSIMVNNGNAYHSQLFWVLVVPSPVGRLSATSRVVFRGQTADVGLLNTAPTIAPDYRLTGTGWFALRNYQQLSNPAGTVGLRELSASLTIQRHSFYDGITASLGTLVEVLADLPDRTVTRDGSAQFSLTLPDRVTVKNVRWTVGGAAAGTGPTLTVADAQATTAVQATADYYLDGNLIQAGAVSNLAYLYVEDDPGTLVLTAVPDLAFAPASGAPFTVAQAFAGATLAATGTVSVADDRLAPGPWQLSVAATGFTPAWPATMTLTAAGQRVSLGVPSAEPVTLLYGPTSTTDFAVTARLALAARTAPVAGQYAATVTWTLTAGPIGAAPSAP